MSRIGLKPIELPAGVEVSIGDNNMVTVKGPKSQLQEYANTRMILNDAATSAVTSVDYDSIEHNTYESKIRKSVNDSYGSRLSNVEIVSFDVQNESKDDYTYQVFNSDKQNKTRYSEQFDDRKSNYHYRNVSLTLSCTEKAITPFGGMFFGGMTWTIKSDPKTCSVYTKGYEKDM